jgi:hypothetical protein
MSIEIQSGDSMLVNVLTEYLLLRPKKIPLVFEVNEALVMMNRYYEKKPGFQTLVTGLHDAHQSADALVTFLLWLIVVTQHCYHSEYFWKDGNLCGKRRLRSLSRRHEKVDQDSTVIFNETRF